jgi:hypothetical protein
MIGPSEPGQVSVQAIFKEISDIVASLDDSEDVLRAHDGQPDALVGAVAQGVSYFSMGQLQTDDRTILVARKT